MFVTSEEWDGNLGGLSGADAKCNTLATNASLPGVYKAWLSDDNESPSTRFTKSNVPYVQINGDTIAYDWDDLVDGGLEVDIISYDENGESEYKYVWTGTTADGTPTMFNCNEWTDNSDTLTGTEGGEYGEGAYWTDFYDYAPCYVQHAIYCFEQ